MKPDVIIVGSGPSGISAAVPLVEAGWQVLMLDAASAEHDLGPALPAMELRSGSDQWRRLLGTDLSMFAEKDQTSPKLRTGTALSLGRSYAASNLIEPENFRLFGMCAAGGSSRIWGAVAAPFGPEELARLSVPVPDLVESYRRVGERIGLSGDPGDDLGVAAEDGLGFEPPLPLHPAAECVLGRYRGRAAALRKAGFRLGRPRQAVIARDRDGREGCNGCAGCLWGCPRGSIYSSAMDLVRLRSSTNFLYRDNFTVRRIERVGSEWRVVASDGATAVVAPVVVLAAGVPATTRLALAALEKYEAEVPLLSNPVAAMAMVIPRLLVSPPPDPPGFAMAQLEYRLDLDDGSGESVVGSLYATEGLPAFEVLRTSALTRPGALAAFRALRHAVLMAICFFPGRFSGNAALVRRTDDRLVIRGGHTRDLAYVAQRTARRLSMIFRRLGAYVLPGAATIADPGSDLHYAGTLALGHLTDENGQLKGADHLYVVDGSVLPYLPATHCTFTIMANADRAMRALVRRGRPRP